jgi:autotransporter-associated beta strand protein
VVFPATVPSGGGSPVVDQDESVVSVSFDAAYTLTIAAGATLTLDPYDSGNGSSPYAAIDDAGAGTVTISGASSTSTIDLAGTVASILMGGGGTLDLEVPLTGGSSSFAFGITTSTSAGGTVNLDAASTYQGSTTIAPEVTSFSVNLEVADALPSSTVLVVNGSPTIGLAGDDQTVAGLDGGTPSATIEATSGTPVLTVAGSGTYAGALAGNLGLTVTANGRLSLTGSSNYSGSTLIDDGADVVAWNSQSFGQTSGVTVAAAGSVQLENSGTPITVDVPLTLGSGHGGQDNLEDLGGGDTWAGPITLTSGSTELLENGSSSGAFVVSGALDGAGSLEVESLSGQPVVLEAPSPNFAGTTTVEAGPLELSSTNALGGTSTPGSGGQVTVDRLGTVELYKSGGSNGNPVSVTIPNPVTALAGATLSTLEYHVDGTFSGPIVLNGPGNVIVDVGTDDNLYLTGQISGSGGLETIGPYTLFLAAPNTYTGGTIVTSGGTLVVQASDGLGTGPVDDPNEGPLLLSPGITLPNAATIEGSSYCGGVLCTFGAGSEPVTWSGPIDLIGATSFAANYQGATAPLEITGAISGSEPLTVNGPVVLAGQNTYTGSTTVASGTLTVNGSSDASTGVTIDGGATLAGNGTVSQISTIGCSTSDPCTVSPGDAPGALTATGTVSFTSGSTLAISLGSSQASSTELVADGGSISGLSLDVLGAASAPFGTVYTILGDTSSSAFAGQLSYDGAPLTQGEQVTILGQKYLVSYDGGDSGHDITLTDLTVVSGAGGGAVGPVLVSLSPDEGPATGGTTVTITGVNLNGASAVTFGTTPAASFQVLSSGTIEAVAPAGTPGASVPVTVHGPGYTTNALPFTYETSSAAPSGGYWLVGADGAVFSFGDAEYHGGANTVPGGPGTVFVGGTLTGEEP